MKQSGVHDLVFDNETQIPELPGSILLIKDREMERKRSALSLCLKRFQSLENYRRERQGRAHRRDRFGDRDDASLEVIMFIPEGFVSMVIGTKGRQIKSFKDESRAEIIVNQPLVGYKQRSVAIRGSLPNCEKAVAIIYEWLERQAHTVSDYDRQAAVSALSKMEAGEFSNSRTLVV